MNPVDLFEQVVHLPDPKAQTDYDRLVGLDDYKERLVKETLLLVDPGLLTEWSRKHYRNLLPALDYFAARPPLFVLAGDVGTGKTALARSFGNEVARRAKVQVHLYTMSLNARGSGAVGEMTRLISGAFRQVRDAVAKSRDGHGRAGRGIILLIDEADALAQSREAAQMHHEDRAGVNSLIRGVDEIAAERLPIAIIMCTNRLDAMDPAVRRRAAAVFEFHRPNRQQRIAVLRAGLHGTNITDREIEALADTSGESAERSHSFTYSDLTQRLIPTLILDAFPEGPVTGARAIEVAKSIKPTPPFRGQREASAHGGSHG
ncbi:ATP-dependent zinc metalloprotease FtsH [Phycisphaerae bacterium RAS2]|nr:ATP-dependent zinc metalloprotease FtsH [Phycisphaerae bacterium RAS2]